MSVIPAPPSITNGVSNQTAADVLKLNMGTALTGPGWDAFLKAIATGDDYVSTVNQFIFKQAFLATASFPYLINRASDEGLSYPYTLGISDDNFRKFALTVTAEKITLSSVLATLSVFYTDFATRASITSSSYEPFNIQPGYQLNLVVDGASIPVTFQSSDFLSVGAATAEEISAAINRYFVYNRVLASATVYTDPSTNFNYVRVFSGALGLQGSVQVLGGQAQDILLFPQKLGINGADTSITWSVHYSPTVSGNARYKFVSGSNPNQLYLLNVGDYVNIYPAFGTSTGFATNNQGTFQVLVVGVDYFEVYNPNMTVQSSVTSAPSSNIYSTITFYQPVKNTIYSNSTYATASLSQKSVLNVYLPAVSPIVQRQRPFGAYFVTPTTLTVPSVPSPAYTYAFFVVISSGPTTATLAVSSTTGFSNGQYIYLGPNAEIGDDLYGPITVTSGHIAFPYTGTTTTGSYRLYGNPALITATLARNQAGVIRAYVPGGVNGITIGHPVRLDGFVVPPGQNVSGAILPTAGKINAYEINVSSVNTSNNTITINTNNYVPITSAGPFSIANYYSMPAPNVFDFTSGPFTVAIVAQTGGPTGTAIQSVFTTDSSSTNGFEMTWRSDTVGYSQLTNNTSGGYIEPPYYYGTNTPVVYMFGVNAGGTMFMKTNNLSTYTTSAGTITAPTGSARLGGVSAVSRPWAGTISEILVSSAVPSSAAFTALYNSYLANKAGNLPYLLPQDGYTTGHWNASDLVNGTSSVGPAWTKVGTVLPNSNPTFSYSGGTITLYDAPLETGIPGPYVYDTNTDNANVSATITNIQTTTTQTLNKGFKYNTITVSDPSKFPNSPGYVVFNFGQPNQLSLVPYVGSFTNSSGGGFILISPNFVFPIDVLSGSSVIYQGVSSATFVPTNPTLLSSTYLTDVPAGLAAAQDAIYGINAGGLGIIFNILYPNGFGLGNWQYPSSNYYKISDLVRIYADNDPNTAVHDAQFPEDFELLY